MRSYHANERNLPRGIVFTAVLSTELVQRLVRNSGHESQEVCRYKTDCQMTSLAAMPYRLDLSSS